MHSKKTKTIYKSISFESEVLPPIAHDSGFAKKEPGKRREMEGHKRGWLMVPLG